MSRKLSLAEGETSRTACARGLLRTGVDEKTGHLIDSAVLAQRVGWASDLVSGMVAVLVAEHWNAVDVDRLASGEDGGGRALPSNAWMALRRLGWTVTVPEGVTVNDRIVRMAQEAAGRCLRWACDGQQATIERGDDPRRALLRLKLPTRPDPRSYQDWTWVSCPVSLPPTIPPGAVLRLPTLRPDGGRVRVDLAYTHAVPKVSRTGHTIALGVDWGLNTLLSAGAVQLRDDGRITPVGAGAQFRAAGVLAKQHRLRRLSERLHTKADHYQRLIDGRAPSRFLAGKHTVLRDEIRHVSARRANLNDALARAAARWAVDQAIAARATVIYLEDLRSMEAKGMGRTMNTRLSQQVRGQIADRIRHLAAEVGIAVVTVPARGTSRHCPQCLTPLRHRQAPDRPTTPGWKWAICPDRDGCGWHGDRDHGAWRRIAARGLTHQTRTVTDRTTRQMAIRSVVDTLEANAVITPTTHTNRDRSKTGPTRRHKPPHPAPGRRRAPSPTSPQGPAGKRPEGHAPTDRPRLPRAAHRHQSVTTISTPTTGHGPRGAALGAGFHLHAHATPPRWAEPTPDTTPDTGSPS